MSLGRNHVFHVLERYYGTKFFRVVVRVPLFPLRNVNDSLWFSLLSWTRVFFPP